MNPVLKFLDNWSWSLYSQIHVRFGNFFKRLPAPQSDKLPNNPSKTIYLTFDDGPSIYTEQLLAVLNKWNVKATFFVTHTPKIALLKTIVQSGHTLGNHTKSHNYREIYSSEENFFKDLFKMEEVIFREACIKTNLIRFPGGSGNHSSRFNPGIMSRLTTAVERLGYHYFDWNVVTNDASGCQSTWEIYRRMVNGARKNPHAVILNHDTCLHSIITIERFIIWGLEHGWTFLPLSEDSPNVHHRKIN